MSRVCTIFIAVILGRFASLKLREIMVRKTAAIPPANTPTE